MSWKFHTRKLLLSQAVLVLMMVFIQSGCAIQCFVCDSSDNPGCTNLKTNSNIVPETCTLDKLKTIDTWLFELNKIAYFETQHRNIPPMNCQKVVAKLSADSEPITARFCQLDTRDTNACSILKEKLLSDSSSRRVGQDGSSKRDEEDNLIHCSICSTDRCNGSERIRVLTALGYIFIARLLKIFG